MPAVADSELPGPGEPLDARLDHYLQGEPIDRVPTGARSLVAPVQIIPCNSGLVAVLDIPGDPHHVEKLFDDADPTDDPMGPVASGVTEGRAWEHGQIATAGGYYLDVYAVADRSGTSTVMLTECGD